MESQIFFNLQTSICKTYVISPIINTLMSNIFFHGKVMEKTRIFPSTVVLADYTRYNKESLRMRLRNFLSTDWLPLDKAKTFPLRGYHVNLDLYQRRRRILQDTFVPLKGLHELLQSSESEISSDPSPKSILLIGNVFRVLFYFTVVSFSWLILLKRCSASFTNMRVRDVCACNLGSNELS